VSGIWFLELLDWLFLFAPLGFWCGSPWLFAMSLLGATVGLECLAFLVFVRVTWVSEIAGP
jgi:hypothetical protein